MKEIEYYIMRHADYHSHDNEFITYRGMITLKESMDKFKVELHKKFPDKKLRIIHSTLSRAKQTALLIENIIGGVEIFRRSDTRLNCHKLLIDAEYIKEVVSECEKNNEICLILSHQPDIKHFCKKELRNSEYLCMYIAFNGEPTTNTSCSSEDDLPF